jgi:hypothetical protein
MDFAKKLAGAVRTKIGGVYDKVASPINAMVKTDLQKMISWATEKTRWV